MDFLFSIFEIGAFESGDQRKTPTYVMCSYDPKQDTFMIFKSVRLFESSSERAKTRQFQIWKSKFRMILFQKLKFWAFKRDKSVKLNFGAFKASSSHGVDTRLFDINYEINQQ